jgi:hypothetical protein
VAIRSKLDILKPEGQKFAIGDLVYICKERPKHMQHFREIAVGTYWWICGSYSQHHRSYTYQHTSQYQDGLKKYTVANPETGNSISWIPEDLMELVDEES